ncbi:MAG TPA: hypothetical protein VIY47_01290 [Ignavibacteriaceae bacterium]
MKKPCLLYFIVFVLFCACNFSKGVKKDLATGLSASYNGFAVTDIFLADNSDNRLSSNKIPLGSEIKIIADGVENYVVKEGKVYPGCSIWLTSKDGKELLFVPDAFSDLKDGKVQNEARALKALLTTGEPMVAGETYHFKAVFFDKLKKENTITAEVDLLMQ